VLAGERVGTHAAEAFIAEADDRGLGEFLENPLNLIMLSRAVQTGSWPITRKELFEFSTKLMLQEFSQEHARFGSGVYTVEELRPVAGAICAARLISDVVNPASSHRRQRLGSSTSRDRKPPRLSSNRVLKRGPRGASGTNIKRPTRAFCVSHSSCGSRAMIASVSG
jgi:hypothetical protein